jgi:hypothetical protein
MVDKRHEVPLAEQPGGQLAQEVLYPAATLIRNAGRVPAECKDHTGDSQRPVRSAA